MSMNSRNVAVALCAALSVAGCDDGTKTEIEAVKVEASPTPSAPKRCTAAPQNLAEPCAELDGAGREVRCAFGELLREADPSLYTELTGAFYSEERDSGRLNLVQIVKGNENAFRDCTPEQAEAIGQRALEREFALLGDGITSDNRRTIKKQAARIKEELSRRSRTIQNNDCRTIDVANPCSDWSAEGCWRVQATMDTLGPNYPHVTHAISCHWDFTDDASRAQGNGTFRMCDIPARNALVTRLTEDSLRTYGGDSWGKDRRVPPKPPVPPAELIPILDASIDACEQGQNELNLKIIVDPLRSKSGLEKSPTVRVEIIETIIQ